MSKRKALPYAAAALIDDAQMALSQARRELKPVLSKSNDFEIVARVGRALDEINQAQISLSEIPKLERSNQ